jgi:hypothetical protein
VQTCVDACKARTGKREKAYKDNVVSVGCSKLMGNLDVYCVAYENKCTPNFSAMLATGLVVAFLFPSNPPEFSCLESQSNEDLC